MTTAPAKIHTFTYREYHFRCGACGFNSVGHDVGGTGGIGYKSPSDSRRAARRHDCYTDTMFKQARAKEQASQKRKGAK